MLHPKVMGQQFRGTSLAISLRLFSLLHWVTGSQWMSSNRIVAGPFNSSFYKTPSAEQLLLNEKDCIKVIAIILYIMVM